MHKIRLFNVNCEGRKYEGLILEKESISSMPVISKLEHKQKNLSENELINWAREALFINHDSKIYLHLI